MTKEIGGFESARKSAAILEVGGSNAPGSRVREGRKGRKKSGRRNNRCGARNLPKRARASSNIRPKWCRSATTAIRREAECDLGATTITWTATR